MLGSIVLGLGAALGAFAAYVATRPSHFSISRSRAIAAPPPVAHAYVNDFRKWAEWSPWEKRDPALTRHYSGQPSGTGAVYAWKGNRNVGEGRMTITDSRPPHNVAIRLEFLKPFQQTNATTFDFAPAGAGTQVSWTMTGENSFMGKAFSVFMNMDKVIGADFEQGLANLDAATAAGAKTPAT